MPTIRMKLNVKSINQALKEVKAYRKKVEKAAEELTRRLTEQGVSLAQLNASYMNIYDTGELMRGIESQYKGEVGFVVSTAAHPSSVSLEQELSERRIHIQRLRLPDGDTM